MFQFLRFWRLYPVYLLFLMAYLLFDCIRWVSVNYRLVQDVRLIPFSQNSGTALVEQLLLIQAIGPTGNVQSFNGPAWSISVEFYAYLLYGLLALVFLLYLPWALIGLLIVSALLPTKVTGFETLLGCFIGFSLGSLLSAFSQRHVLPMPTWAVSTAMCAFFGYLVISTTTSLGVVLALAAAVIVLAVSGAGRGRCAVRLLSGRHSLWLSAISHSIHMCHALVLWLTAILVKSGGLKETLRIDGKCVLDLSLSQAATACALPVVAALLLAYLVMRFVETFFRDWSRKMTRMSPLDPVSVRESSGLSS